MTQTEFLEYSLWFLYFLGLFFILFWVSIIYMSEPKKPYKIIPKTRLPKITLLIPMWNEQETIERTLQHVFCLDYPQDKLRVICINDGSTDQTLPILERLQKTYNFEIITQPNQGKYVALNNGIKQVKTKYFLCLDADSYPQKDALLHLVSEMETNNYATLSPVMEVYNPKTLVQKLQWVEYLISVFVKYLSSKVDGMMVVSGPFSIYNTAYTKKIGGFTHGYMTEDFEIALRFQKNKYKLGQSQYAKVYTSSPKTLTSLIKQRVRWNLGNILCMKDYIRYFFLNPKFKDFGLFVFPTMLFASFFLLVAFSIVFYLLAQNILTKIRNFALVNYDIITYIKNPSFDITWYLIDWRIAFLIICSVGILSFMFYKASKETNIPINVKVFLLNIIPFIFFVFLFRFLMLIIWIIVIKRLILRTKLQWLK